MNSIDILVMEPGLSRRELLARAAVAVPVLAGAARLAPPAAAQTADTIVKPLPPEWFTRIGTNAEMRWDAVRELGYLVPNERFFVRNHTATPAIDPRTWRLRVHGSGLRRPDGIALTYRELRRMPSRTITAAIECAGNGRSFFASQQGTPATGSAWKLGAIGVARWRGVPLRAVLERAGLTRHAVDVLPVGLDAEVGTDGHVRRPLPIAKALDDVLVAYEMNGAPLPPDHGFPVRLVVPGWVGIASIKWLGELEVADHPLVSPWNTKSYRMIGPRTRPTRRRSPTSRSERLRAPLERRCPRATDRLHRRSWSGTAAIRVEVSTDGGPLARRTCRPDVRARVAVEHDVLPDGRPRLPAGRAAADRAAGEERVRAALGGAARPRPHGPARGTLVVGRGGDRARRGEHRRRRALAAGPAPRAEPAARLGAVVGAVAARRRRPARAARTGDRPRGAPPARVRPVQPGGLPVLGRGPASGRRDLIRARLDSNLTALYQRARDHLERSGDGRPDRDGRQRRAR